MSQEHAPETRGPQPTAEHGLLAKHAGTWNVHCKFYMQPGEPPMECEATETVELVGPFWTLSTFRMDMGGMPFQGHATLGYEPEGQRWVSTWIDSMGPYLYTFTGCHDAGSDTLTMTGENYNCHIGAMSMHRTVEKALSDTERSFEMYVTMPEVGEVLLMEYRYTKA